jgi:hypothetical protein
VQQAIRKRIALPSGPWHRPQGCQHPALMPTERRRAKRSALDLPLRLRLGADLFPGYASDVSAGGIGLWCVPQPGTAHLLDLALVGHERGCPGRKVCPPGGQTRLCGAHPTRERTCRTTYRTLQP